MVSDAGENYAFEPYQLSDFGIQSEPLQFNSLMIGQVLANLRGNKYTVVCISRSFDFLGKFSSGEATLLDEEGSHKSEDQNSIGQYRIHTQPTEKETMRFNVPTTTAATSFSTINPADAVVLEDAPVVSVPERITELGEDDEVTPSRLLLTLPAEVVQALAHAELARDTVFTGDCTLDQIATDRLERILPRLVGLLTEDEVPKRDW